MGKRLLGGLVAVVVISMLCGASSASALSGAPLTIASGGKPGYLSVAVDGSGDAIAVWAEKASPGNEVVRYCVVPPGGSSCAAGTLTPAGGKAGFKYVYDTQVLTEGSAVAILADVDVGGTDYETVQEWRSADGGQTFTAANGGKAIASGNPAAGTEMRSAVKLPGGTSLGVGFVSPSVAPTFHAFSLSNPTLCGRETYPSTNCTDHYATLAPGTDQDQASNEPGNFVADDTGVLGVFRTNYSSGNLGCPGASPFGLAYVFGTGSQSTSNNYNVSPGAAGTAWRKGVTLADCGVDYIAAGGGPSGFGVLEDNQITGQTQYHRFDAATQSFAAAPTVVSGTGEQQPSVSQDGAGGVYATYLSGGIGGPVSLSYSFDGGTTWTGPGALASDPAGAITGLTSSVDPLGQGWASWIENGAVHLQQFVASDAGSQSAAPTPPPTASIGPATTTLSTRQKAGAQAAASISVPVGTTGETDQATIVGANAPRATGAVTYTLYSSPTCSSSSAVASSTVAVNGAVAGASAPVTAVLAPGTYYWTAAYGGDAANGPSSSACGGQVLTVEPPNAIAAGATSDGTTLTFGASCVTVPCTLQASATAGGSGTANALTDRKAKTVKLGKGKFKIAKKGTRLLTLKLSGAGRHYLAGKHKSKVTLAVTEKVGGRSFVTRRTVTVKVTHRRRSKK